VPSCLCSDRVGVYTLSASGSDSPSSPLPSPPLSALLCTCVWIERGRGWGYKAILERRGAGEDPTALPAVVIIVPCAVIPRGLSLDSGLHSLSST
jgi:hypothetical protein